MSSVDDTAGALTAAGRRPHGTSGHQGRDRRRRVQPRPYEHTAPRHRGALRPRRTTAVVDVDDAMSSSLHDRRIDAHPRAGEPLHVAATSANGRRPGPSTAAGAPLARATAAGGGDALSNGRALCPSPSPNDIGAALLAPARVRSVALRAEEVGAIRHRHGGRRRAAEGRPDRGHQRCGRAVRRGGDGDAAHVRGRRRWRTGRSTSGGSAGDCRRPGTPGRCCCRRGGSPGRRCAASPPVAGRVRPPSRRAPVRDRRLGSRRSRWRRGRAAVRSAAARRTSTSERSERNVPSATTTCAATVASAPPTTRSSSGNVSARTSGPTNRCAAGSNTSRSGARTAAALL